MRSDAWLRIVNPVLLLVVLLQAITGLGIMLFDWEAVYELHGFNGIVLLVVVAVHLTLNRRWFRVAYRRRA